MSNNLVFRKDILNSTKKDQMINETLFHSANGYIGVRSAIEENADAPDSVRGVYINGVYETVDVVQPEPLYGLINKKDTIANLAEIQDIKFIYNGKVLSAENFKMECHQRFLDMGKGISGRTVIYNLGDNETIILSYRRAALFARKNVFVITIDIKASKDITLNAETVHHGDVSNAFNPDDPRMASEKGNYILVDSSLFQNNISLVLSHLKESGIKVASALCDIPDADVDIHTEIVGSKLNRYFTIPLEKDKEISFTRYVSISDSVRNDDHEELALRELKSAVDLGIDSLLREQELFLASFWDRVGLDISGSDKNSIAINYCLYNLLQSAGSDGVSLLAAKGLSGEGYEGHYFWDCEMYIVPLIVLSDPKSALKLLEYRFNTLEKARDNARIMGHRRGALYPWRTISGRECSAFFPAGSAQYHINGAIAYALIFYYQCTKDEEFMRTMGLEILTEISRLWMDVGNFASKGFVINDVTGPDEYTCIVNNNYYTNCSAKYDLDWTARLLDEFDKDNSFCSAEEKALFREAAEKMYLPYDEKLGIDMQDDSFLNKKVWDFDSTPKENYPLLLHYHPLHLYRYQVCKQADTVLANILYPEYTTKETIKKNFDYYGRITTHDSSLSKCVFAMAAARLGDVDEAYNLFSSSLSIDLEDTHGNTKDGIHTANMGGSYLCLLYGFLGLKVQNMKLSLSPNLPSAWDKLSLNINYQGRSIRISLYKDSVELELIKGGMLELAVYGEKIEITGERKTIRK